MDFNYLQARNDFRCAVCRQKTAFHCEHDTPYRDQYLGSYDPYRPRETLINTRRANSENGTYNSSINSGRINTKQQVNSNAGAKYQQKKTLVQTNESSKIHEENKKSKSCVIL